MRKIFIGLIAVLFLWGVAGAELTINLPKTGGGVSVQNQLHPYSSQSMTADTASATASLVLVGQVVRLYSTVDCFVDISASSGAVAVSASSLFLPSGVVETFTTRGYQYVAVIAADATETGTLYITDLY